VLYRRNKIAGRELSLSCQLGLSGVAFRGGDGGGGGGGGGGCKFLSFCNQVCEHGRARLLNDRLKRQSPNLSQETRKEQKKGYFR
jgi:hypothetical protein